MHDEDGNACSRPGVCGSVKTADDAISQIEKRGWESVVGCKGRAQQAQGRQDAFLERGHFDLRKDGKGAGCMQSILTGETSLYINRSG